NDAIKLCQLRLEVVLRFPGLMQGRGGRGTGRGAVQPGKEVARREYKAQFYAFPGKTEVEASDVVTTCTILNCDRMANETGGLGLFGFLAHIRDVGVESPFIESISVVSSFREVLPTDSSVMPPDRDIYFRIDLETRTRPIPIPSYRIAPVELRGLKVQI
ncbi:hypothetical protein MTR67_031464, partial [Solanum verrucosum]